MLKVQDGAGRAEPAARAEEFLEFAPDAILAGGIAYDFNNRLGIILNYAQSVADELPAGSPMRQDVEELRDAAHWAAALTRRLLIFSRREIMRPQLLDLNAVLADHDGLLRRALGEHVAVETVLASDLPGVRIDPWQVEQMLVNLAANARDAMPRGGRLRIETTDVELDERFAEAPAGRYVRLVVSDTGAGMAPAVAARAFEPFFSTKRNGQGTGLGLATVYGIVSEAGGDIHISSEPGLGTTVEVHLPAIPMSAFRASPAEPQRPEQPRGGGETVLVVEDEDRVRVLTQRILVGAGYRVLFADRGIGALEICACIEEPIDLLLTDVVMPEMLGPELVQRAIALRPRLKVLYLSGYAHGPLAQLDVAEPVDVPSTEQPFTAEDLLRRVREVLDAAPARAVRDPSARPDTSWRSTLRRSPAA
jgi:CheY-like chemotaxis protein